MTSLDDLLSGPLPALPPVPWADLERIDTTVRRVAARLQEAPWLLPKLLPSLTVLARERSARWNAWAQQGEHCSPADLRALLEPAPTAEPEPPGEPPAPAALLAPSPAVPLGDEIDQAKVDPIASGESAPVTQEMLKTFVQEFGRRTFTSPLIHERDPGLCRRENLVRDILERLGEIPARIERLQVNLWRSRVEALTSVEWLKRWTELDGPLQVDLLTMMVALGRAVQEAAPGKEEPRKMFHRLSAYSREQQPGFTHGMARNHRPRGESWISDARKAQETLRTWLGERPTPSAIPSPAMPPLARTRSNAPPEAPAPPPPEDEGEEEQGSILAQDWAWWPEVRGKRAILVGGSPKEPCRLRLLEAFHFASLDWVDGDVRRVASVTESIAHGGLDLVLIVQAFTGHKTSKKVLFACKNRGVPCVFVERGHGVLAVCRSIERYLRPSASLSA